MQELTLETAVSILMFQDGILRFIFALSGCVAFGFKFKPVAWLTGCAHRIAAGPTGAAAPVEKLRRLQQDHCDYLLTGQLFTTT